MQQIEFKGLGKMPVNLTRWFRCSKREQPSRPGVYAVGYEALLQPGGSVIGWGYDHFDGSKWGASATVVTETGGGLGKLPRQARHDLVRHRRQEPHLQHRVCRSSWSLKGSTTWKAF